MQKFGSAQPARRVEDGRFLTGTGRYTDDIVLPGMLHGVIVRSPHAAAMIRSVDIDAARNHPKVAGVYTAADLDSDGIGNLPCAVSLNNRDGTTLKTPEHPALARHTVRHVGDPVAFVVAETVEAAFDAAEAVDVQYDLLPSITDLKAAVEAGAPLVWPEVERNISFDWETGDKTRVDALFASAAHVTRLEIRNNRVVAASMETRAALAEYDTNSSRWTLYTNTQGVWLIKDLLSRAVFGVDPDRFRVVTMDVGGGFGMKIFLYAEHVLTCYAARKLGRPVKWTSTRSEAFVADTHGRDNVTFGELALDGNDKVIALRSTNFANMGAYLSTYAPYIPTLAGSKVLAGVYDFQAVYLNTKGVFTNTVPVDAYRGAGRPESNYVVERLMDAAARELGKDPIELRLRNMVPPSAMPYRSAMGELYDSGNFGSVLKAGLHRIDYDGFGPRRQESAARGRLRGLGLAYYVEATMGAPTERAEIRFKEGGDVEVFVGTQSTGQGHETAYVRLTAEQLGIPAERIRIRQGDSDLIPTGGGTGGSRSLYTEGKAILATVESVIRKGKTAAAEHLEAAESDIEFRDGSFRISGTDRQVDILVLAAEQRRRGGAGLDAAEEAAVEVHTFPNGCHLAEVEVDPDTGSVDLLRYVVSDDMGRILNPPLVRGQIHGGVAQGVGQALLENVVYDSEFGQLLSGSFTDYALPRAADLPDIEVELIEIPCASNPLGVKGAGEAGALGSPPAVVNAVLNALAERSVTSLDMPITSETVWRALSGAKLLHESGGIV